MIELAEVAVTVLIAVGGAGWAVWGWNAQRRREQEAQRDSEDFRYLNPFLVAANDLQSRVFNILERNGLGARPPGEDTGRAALELLHMTAKYLAWVQLVLRFTSFSRDPMVVSHTIEIRNRLASNSRHYRASDPWCIFRPQQAALAQSVTYWYEQAVFADTLSILDFEDLLRTEDFARRLGVERALSSFDGVEEVTDKTTIARLGDVQTILTCLIEKSEDEIGRRVGKQFSLSPGRARDRVAGSCPVCGSPDRALAIATRG